MSGKSLARAAFWVVMLHFAINLIHGWAHEDKSVAVTLGQNLFIFPVILFGPFIAYGLIRKQWERSGYLTLALTMLGSLIFGIAWHFTIDSPDHVRHVQGGVGASVFFWTSVGLAVIEAAGAGIGAYGFVRALNAGHGRAAGAVA